MTMEYLFQHARVARVALIKRHILRNQPTASPRKVIEDHHRPTAVSARPYGVAADVAGPSRNQCRTICHFAPSAVTTMPTPHWFTICTNPNAEEIGRAACRERVSPYV